MKVVLLLCAIVGLVSSISVGELTTVASLIESLPARSVGKEGNGGTECMACTILLHSDRLCRALKICLDKHCNLFDQDDAASDDYDDVDTEGARTQLKNALANLPARTLRKLSLPFPIPPLDGSNHLKDHKPVVDNDGDDYSTIETLRGAHWRGRDCDDDSSEIYPGRKSDQSPDKDSNCNGIRGNDEQGVSYEEKFCSGTNPLGFIVFGDSASAHFHVPMVNATIDELIRIAEDELDVPQCSWGTGYWSTAQCPQRLAPINSLYSRLRSRNRCAHRDFENISVNGCRSTAMSPKTGGAVVNSTHRNPLLDRPVLGVISMVGDDVCNPHPGGDHMTEPAEFKQRVTETLQYLDTILPRGSHMLLMGLFNGSIIWPTMHAQIHPALGVPYADLWAYISCLVDKDNRTLNACWGWLNSDPHWRQFTTDRAMNLSATYQQILKEHSFTNFDMAYVEEPSYQNYLNWKAKGNNPVDLFEPVGGGHPSQTQHALIADSVWNTLEHSYPHFLPPVNPHNADIEKVFGDQGGY